MPKKIISILFVFMLLLSITPVNNALSINKSKNNNEEKDKEIQTSEDDFISRVNNTFNIDEEGFHFKSGFFNISTNGIGFHAMMKFNIFSLNVQIPTPQRPTIFPFVIRIWLCYIKYCNDENAYTRIYKLDGEEVYNKTGPHTIIFPIIESNSIMGIIKLFDDGIIDGFAGYRWFINSIPLINSIFNPNPINKIVTVIRDFLGLEPLFNVSDPVYEFFKPFWNDSEPLFFDGDTLQTLVDGGYIGRYIINLSKIQDVFPIIYELIIPGLISFFDTNFYIFGRMFINRIFEDRIYLHIPILALRFPMDVSGYATPFVAWKG